MRCTARVIVTLDVPVQSTWGPECTVAQVQKQAKDDARGFITRAVQGKGARVVGEMLVSATITEEP